MTLPKGGESHEYCRLYRGVELMLDVFSTWIYFWKKFTKKIAAPTVLPFYIIFNFDSSNHSDHIFPFADKQRVWHVHPPNYRAP